LWAVTRITLHIKSRDLKIDDKEPFELKPAELRKACAQVKILTSQRYGEFQR